MKKNIKQEEFLNTLFGLMEETFEKPRGIYLDKGTALFQTLETVSAQETSIPVGGKCASLAAQVAHVIFYMGVLERYAVNNNSTPADWGEIWRTVEKATPEEWNTLKSSLNDAYHRTSKIFRDNDVWNEDSMGGSLAIVVHTAYHLGEIRQALCVLKASP